MKNKIMLMVEAILQGGIVAYCIYLIIHEQPSLFYLFFLILYAIGITALTLQLLIHRDRFEFNFKHILAILVLFLIVYTTKLDIQSEKWDQEWEASKVSEKMISDMLEENGHGNENVLEIIDGYDDGYAYTLTGNELRMYQMDTKKIVKEEHYTFDQSIEIIDDSLKARAEFDISFTYSVGDEIYGFNHYIDYETKEAMISNQYIGLAGEENTEEFACHMLETFICNDEYQVVSFKTIEGEELCDGILIYEIDGIEGHPEVDMICYNDAGITCDSTICYSEDYGDLQIYETMVEGFSIEYSDHLITIGPVDNGEYQVMETYSIKPSTIEWGGNIRLESNE